MPNSAPDYSVTQLLQQWRAGDAGALEALMPLVYDQLRALAGRYMRSERPDHTLRATAVVHEAYLRLVGAEINFEDRAHFYAVAAKVMRRILLDWARANHRVKRGAGAIKVEWDDGAAMLSSSDPETLLELELALQRLDAIDKRKAALVEMLFFGGLTYEEAAAALGISMATAHRDIRVAKAWLYNELRSEGQPGAGS